MSDAADDQAQTTTYSDEEFKELIGFLQDAKPEVQRFAAEGVCGLTADQGFVEFCKRQPRSVAKPLLRLVERAEESFAQSSVVAESVSGQNQKQAEAVAFTAAGAGLTASSALQALVNLSGLPAVLEELVRLNAPRRIAESMRSGWMEGRAEFAHWQAMLLANLSTSKSGREALCTDASLLQFLIGAFAAKPRPPPRDGHDDPLITLGKLLGNVCASPEGRRLLASEGRGASTLLMLKGELGDRSRRPDVVNIFRNVCLDEECHQAVIDADPVEQLANFLCPWDKMSAEHRQELPKKLREALAASGATLTGDGMVRHTSAIAACGLCAGAKGRTYLRGCGFLQVAQAWLQEEPDEAVRTVLEGMLPSVQLSEEELAAHAAKVEPGDEKLGGMFDGVD
mmetsp:Transcript_51708/g.102852  ORF Transcript_51708/g.102852 Transcript_51708/m.102852 type:complete len:397 (-) Transcript_51708:64-1254(-)